MDHLQKNWCIFKKWADYFSCIVLRKISHRHTRTYTDNIDFLPGRPALAKASSLLGIYLILSRFSGIAVFCLHRLAGSKPCAKSGRGGKMSVPVCVCRASFASGWLIQKRYCLCAHSLLPITLKRKVG